MAETPATRKWRAIVQAQEHSGLTVRAFAEQHGLKFSTLTWWRGRLRAMARDKATFTSLTVVPATSSLHVRLAGGRAEVDINEQTDLGLLRRVVDALS